MATYPGISPWTTGQTWIQSAPPIITSGTTNVYYGAVPGALEPPTPPKEPTPFEWLRGQVDEVCELARAA